MKGITTLILCLLLSSVTLAGGEPNEPIIREPGLTFWAEMDNSLERIIGLRGGFENKYGFEFGGTALWQVKEDWDASPDWYGLYVAYHADELASVDDSDGFSGIEDLLHLLIGRPYFIIMPLYSDIDDNIDLGIGAGTVFSAKEDERQTFGITLEYLTIPDYGEKLKLGVRFKF